jgi:hypothetical protein
VKGLACDSTGNALAVVGGKLLCRRTADGVWHTCAKSDIELACCVALGPQIYAGVEDGAYVMLVRDDGTLERLPGFDHVGDRNHWYAGTALVNGQLVGPPLGIRSMTATCDGKVLLANVHVGGIPRSTDRGITWQATIDVDCDVHQVCAHPTRPELVAAATGVGLAMSADGGETWTIEHEGLHAPYCSAVAFVGEDILVSASSDHFATQGAIYRRRVDCGGPLLPVGGGLPRWIDGIADTGNLNACGPDVAVIDRAGNLFVSDDIGRTWTRRNERLPTPSSLLVVEMLERL